MQATDRILGRVATRVFETMTFTSVISVDDLEPGPEPRLASGVSFEGPCAGRVVLEVPRHIVPELAGNMLGEDQSEVSDQQQRDALGELANIICGNLVQELGGPDPVFRLGSPVTSAAPDPGATPPETPSETPSDDGAQPPRARARLTLENGWAVLSLHGAEGLA
jgi:hypothetical protein